MALIEWKVDTEVEQDPNASLDYFFDLSPFLAADPDIPGSTDDTIASFSMVVEAANVLASPILGVPSIDYTKQVYFRVSNVDDRGRVTARITMDSGNIVDFSLTFVPKEK